MKLFNPISNSWIYVTSAQLINGQFTVYDLRTTSGDYIAIWVCDFGKVVFGGRNCERHPQYIWSMHTCSTRNL